MQYRRSCAPDREFPRLTSDATTADAAPTRRSSRPAAAVPATAGAPGMTRAQWRRLQSAGAAYDASAASAEAAAVEAAAVEAAAVSLASVILAEEAVVSAGHQTSIAEAILVETAMPLAQRRRDRRIAAEAVESIADVPQSASVPATFAAAPAAVDDEFVRVAQLFSFTGQTPVLRPASAVAAHDHAAVSAGATRPAKRGILTRVAAASFSVGAMAVVGLLAVGTASPAMGVAGISDPTADISLAATTSNVAAAPKDIQAFVSAQGDGAVTLDRSEGYDVASMAEVAAESGVTLFSGAWVNDPNAEVQWPFPVGVPISAAYGSQSYLSQFSTPHHGVDLTPGLGAEIHAIAAGTVRLATEAGGDYGVTVLIDHVIDGQPVSTRYGHMLRGSLQVEQGDTVAAGQVIGKVGQTGKATGPHLHLEVLLNGTARTDPMAWLEEHTAR